MAGCGRSRPAERPTSPPEPGAEAEPTGEEQVGIASYYHNRFTGRRTASGDRYDPDEMTAAHRTLPFGTVVRVERVDGRGEPVTVRINDRGPYARGRVIDLSMAAARRLDMLRVGVVKVRVRVLRSPRPRDQRRTSLYIGPSCETTYSSPA